MEKVTAKLKIRNELGRALVGEFLGTLVLVLVIGCVCAQSVIPRPSLNALINVNVGVGLGIAFGIAICAKVSGGHINPAVSLMFLTFGQINALRFVLYTLVQTAGAFVGAALAYVVYKDAINVFDGGERQVYGNRATAQIFASYSNSHLGAFNGLMDQIISTALFCLFIAHVTDKRNRYPAWVQPLVIGTVFVMVGTCFAYNAGYPCNPARDFGPRLFTLLIGYGFEVFSYKDYGWFWIPIVGPFIGAVLGAWIYKLVQGLTRRRSTLAKTAVESNVAVSKAITQSEKDVLEKFVDKSEVANEIGPERIYIKLAHFDDELAAYNSFKRQFSNAVTKMCALHVKQALNRQVQTNDFSNLYSSDGEVQAIVRMLGALQLAPTMVWNTGLLLIRNRIQIYCQANLVLQRKLEKLVDYFRDTCIKLVDFFSLRRMRGQKTKNTAESYHGKQRNHFRQKMPLGEWIVEFKEICLN